jgi:hypothetical protein
MHNHKKFIILIIISIIYCFSNIALLTIILIKLKDNPIESKHLNSFKNINYILTIFLITIVGVATVLLVILIFFQLKFIAKNETTSENIRRSAGMINLFDKGCKQNIKDFVSNIGGYKCLVNYNTNSKGYLSSVRLVTEFYNLIEIRISKSRSLVSNVSINLENRSVSINTNNNNKYLTEEKN